MPAPSPIERVLRFDVFELDVRLGELRKKGARLRLQGQPLQVLAALLRRPGELVTREELRDEIWSADTFVDFDHSLHNAIARIRGVLGDSATSPRYIETLPRRGYRFIPAVEEVGLRNTNSPFPARSTSDPSRIQAIAVLPLEDTSGKEGEEYFAESMTEALITSLAKIKGLRVISRTSAMQYKGARKSLPQIARELNVDAVIEGSVLRSGERVRITAQLIHAASDQHLWAESYERDFRDVLAIQSDIAQKVANEVRIALTPEERMRLGNAPRVDPRAHELYLKARYYWNKRTDESVKRALSAFQSALDHDPTYAPGYAGMADCYNILGYYNALPSLEAYSRGRAAALKALELDDSLAGAHATLGVVKRDFEWDWPGAEAEFERSVALNPGCVEAYHWRGTLFSMLGRHAEALREKTTALTMDPLSVVVTTDLARMTYFTRDYDRAVKEFRAAIAMDFNFGSAHLWLAHVYEQKGLFPEALAELKIGIDLSGESTYALAKLGHCHAIAGKADGARAILKQLHALSDDRYVSPYDIAMIHAGLRENDEAFKWLNHAFEQRSPWLGYMNIDPQLDDLRRDTRFQELLTRIGLRPSSAGTKRRPGIGLPDLRGDMGS
jgi:TolB-like protein/Flp pilus assembly protein TadD